MDVQPELPFAAISADERDQQSEVYVLEAEAERYDVDVSREKIPTSMNRAFIKGFRELQYERFQSKYARGKLLPNRWTWAGNLLITSQPQGNGLSNYFSRLLEEVDIVTTPYPQILDRYADNYALQFPEFYSHLLRRPKTDQRTLEGIFGALQNKPRTLQHLGEDIDWRALRGSDTYMDVVHRNLMTCNNRLYDLVESLPNKRILAFAEYAIPRQEDLGL